MFQARYVLFYFLFLTTLLCSLSFAEEIKIKENKRANYVLVNMHQDYITCYIFYKIGAEAIKSSEGKNDITNGIDQSADTSLKLAFETGELLGMSVDDMSAKVKVEMKSQSKEIQNDYNNASKLLNKYGSTCKNLIQDKKQRIDFWEKKALNKFK
jgi:hypothetical protein